MWGAVHWFIYCTKVEHTSEKAHTQRQKAIFRVSESIDIKYKYVQKHYGKKCDCPHNKHMLTYNAEKEARNPLREITVPPSRVHLPSKVDEGVFTTG